MSCRIAAWARSDMSIAVKVLKIQAWITTGARYNKLSVVGKSTLSRRQNAGRQSSFTPEFQDDVCLDLEADVVVAEPAQTVRHML